MQGGGGEEVTAQALRRSIGPAVPAKVQVLCRRTMEPECGADGSAAAAGQLLADGAGRSEQLEKGLLARMPPFIVDACIAKMSVFNFSPADVIIERDTLGTSMVRPSQPPPQKFVTRVTNMCSHCVVSK